VIGLLFAALFIALNGFFVAAEFALVKVSAGAVEALSKSDRRSARAANVVSQLERYLSVTQLGITLASLGLGWIGEPAIERLVLRGVAGYEFDERTASIVHVIAIAIAFTALTFGHVLFGELVPKLVAIQRSQQLALFVASPLHIVFVAFRPLLWVLERCTKLILRSVGMSEDAASEGKMSEDEIIGILAANTARSPEGRTKSELVARVLKFAQRTARHAMVPRVDVFSLPIDTTGKEALVALKNNQYSRVLLTKEKSLDEVAGYLYAKDFLLDDKAHDLPNLTSLRRDVLLVPQSKGLMEVLREMQRTQIPFAVVFDEYGGSSGIVTMEDLLEEIVGEIRDEFDERPTRLVAVEKDTWDVDARMQVEELRHLGVIVAPEEWGSPIGAVVLARLGRIPKRGDRVDLSDHVEAEITSVSRRRVMSVRIRIKTAEPSPESS